MALMLKEKSEFNIHATIPLSQINSKTLNRLIFLLTLVTFRNNRS